MITHNNLQVLLKNFSVQPGCSLKDLEYLLDHFKISRTSELDALNRQEFFWIVNDLLFNIKKQATNNFYIVSPDKESAQKLFDKLRNKE